MFILQLQLPRYGYVASARGWMTFIAELAFERGHTCIDLAGQVTTA